MITFRVRGTVIAALAVLTAGIGVVHAPPAASVVTVNQRMLELVNQDRMANGLRPVVADATLSATAEDAPYAGCGFPVAGRAVDMGVRNYFSHTVKDCGTQSVFSIVTSIIGFLFSGAAENIVWMNGTTDPLVAAANMHSQLMASAGHRANILNPAYTKVGIGSWRSAPGQTWSGAGYPLTNVYIAVEIFAGGPVDTTVVTPPPGARFHPLTPSRVVDTRSGSGAPAGPVGPGARLAVQVTGRGGVPSTGVSAVVLNVTATQPSAAGWLTVFPAGEPLPLTANLNFGPGQTVANLVVSKLGSGGQISVHNAAGTTHVVADVAGWYDSGTAPSGARFHPAPPRRILDTRAGNGAPVAAVAPGATLTLQVSGRGGVPSTGVSAVVLNVTATQPTAAGWLTVFPAGEATPLAANLNFTPGQTIPNLVVGKLGAGGQVSVHNSAGTTHVVADVAGWYDDGNDPAGARFHPLSPSRLLDTRSGLGAPASPVGPAATLTAQVSGRGGVPSTGVSAVVLNVTATQPTAAGWATVFPAGDALPLAANLNFVPGQTIPNLVVAKLGTDGRVSIHNAVGTTHVIADVAGWYDTGSQG